MVLEALRASASSSGRDQVALTTPPCARPGFWGFPVVETPPKGSVSWFPTSIKTVAKIGRETHIHIYIYIYGDKTNTDDKILIVCIVFPLVLMFTKFHITYTGLFLLVRDYTKQVSYVLTFMILF